MIKNLSACVLSVLFLSLPLDADLVDGIAAVVNDGVITYSELRERTEPFSRPHEDAEGEFALEKIRERELDALIEERLVREKALELGISVSREDVQNELDDIKGSFPSQEKFTEFLRARNLTEPILRDRIKTRILLGKAVEIEIMPGVNPPSGEEARAFYDKNPQVFTEPRRYRLDRILASAGDGESVASARAKIREIEKKISEGGDFALLAERYSDGPEAAGGGDLGFVDIEEITSEIASAVSGLAAGEMSRVVRTEEGFSVFRVAEITGRRRAEFDEVEDAVTRHLFRLRAEEAVDGWLENLRAGACIEVKNP